jgi:hypothetical protein
MHDAKLNETTNYSQGGQGSSALEPAEFADHRVIKGASKVTLRLMLRFMSAVCLRRPMRLLQLGTSSLTPYAA